MSLRLNLYGWRASAFRDVIGSANPEILERATSEVTHVLKNEPAWLPKAKAWLRTLIIDGFPLKEQRSPPVEPDNGDLLTVRMETEVHVFAVYCVARAIAKSDDLDLAAQSSDWNIQAVDSLYRELDACAFIRSRSCPIEFFTWVGKLQNGSPLFGDDFKTNWSYYTLFSNEDLSRIIPVLQAAIDFKRKVPEGYPDEITRQFVTCLSNSGKEFAQNLIDWFGKIQRVNQDAFLMWW